MDLRKVTVSVTLLAVLGACASVEPVQEMPILPIAPTAEPEREEVDLDLRRVQLDALTVRNRDDAAARRMARHADHFGEVMADQSNPDEFVGKVWSPVLSFDHEYRVYLAAGEPEKMGPNGECLPTPDGKECQLGDIEPQITAICFPRGVTVEDALNPNPEWWWMHRHASNSGISCVYVRPLLPDLKQGTVIMTNYGNVKVRLVSTVATAHKEVRFRRPGRSIADDSVRLAW